MELAKIYPYVVPYGYVEDIQDAPNGFIASLGHDIFAMLVEDCDGICSSVLLEQLAQENLTPSGLHRLALDNLETLASGEAIHKSMHQGPSGFPFVLWHGHWLTASCIRLPGLYKFASKQLNTDSVCVSIPQREAMLLFPVGTKEQRTQMRSLIRENEQDARKLVTWELFTLSATGVSPFIDS